MLVIRKEKLIVSPRSIWKSPLTSRTVALSVSDRDGVGAVVAVSAVATGELTVAEDPTGLAVAVAVLWTPPAETSAAVIA